MINTDRIVPIQTIDLLTMYSVILNAANKTVTALNAQDTNGTFAISANPSGAVLASEPVRTLNFGEGVTAATVYFVAAYEFKGFTINGVAETPTGATITPDARTLYSATLANGAVTIAQIGL